MLDFDSILDANLNRAAEGLRTMEDIARFALGDEKLTRELKDCRHRVRLLALATHRTERDLARARGRRPDPGRKITGKAESRRQGTSEVVAAAARRTAEALRSMREAGRALKYDLADAETIRYRVYDLEKALIARLDLPWTQRRLCVLITESSCTHHPWLEVARLAIEGGADCLQLREKNLPDRELLARAEALVDLATKADHPVGIIINDRVDIALAAKAHGVHVGQTDLPAQALRNIARDTLSIGVSCSTPDQARDAIDAGADTIGLGPMFPSSTKHKDTIVGPELLRTVTNAPLLASIPHLAIGGITADNLPALTAVGVRGIAVCAVVAGSSDPAAACAQLLTHLPQQPEPTSSAQSRIEDLDNRPPPGPDDIPEVLI